MSCTGPGCAFECNGGDCTFACPQGGCTVYVAVPSPVVLTCGQGGNCGIVASGPGTREVKCPLGGCTEFCSGADLCQITDCPNGCILRCDGVADGGCINPCNTDDCHTYIQ